MTVNIRKLESILVSKNQLADYLFGLPEKLAKTSYNNTRSVGETIEIVEAIQKAGRDLAVVIIDKNISPHTGCWREDYSRIQQRVQSYFQGYFLAFNLDKTPKDNLAVPELALFIRDNLKYEGPLGVICEKRSFTDNLFDAVLPQKKVTTLSPGDILFELINVWAVEQISNKMKTLQNVS